MAEQPIEQIWDLFRGSETAHGKFSPGSSNQNGKVQGSATTKSGPANQQDWDAHIAGRVGVGVIPIMSGNSAWWGAIDIDVMGIDHTALEQEIEALQLPLITARSKSGGAHCYLFANEPVPCEKIAFFLSQCADVLGYGGCEIFPKQEKLKDDEKGNWLNMPYFYAERTNRYAIRNGEPLDLPQFVEYASSKRVSPADLIAPQSYGDVSYESVSGFELPETIPEGSGPYLDSKGKEYWGRNALLYRYGCSLRAKGASDDEVDKKLRLANSERCQPVLPDSVIRRIIRQANKRERGEPSRAKQEKIPKLPAIEKAVWPAPASIPRLERLYGHHYVRGFVSITAGPGGIGKSSLSQAEVVMMLADKGMLVEDRCPEHALNVLYVNLEDDRNQIWRHFLATTSHYSIDPNELEGRLYVHSGQDHPIKVAELRKHDLRVWNELVDELIAFVSANQIDVVIFDPFVSLHNVNENDNGQVDAVVKELGRLAAKGKCAVELVHHSRKTNGEGQSVETIRGARSLTDAVRMARVLDTMTEQEAENFGLVGFDEHGREKPSHRRYIYERSAKSNLAPPADKRVWYFMESVAVGNAGKEQDLEPSDWVGVPTRWAPPEGEPLFEDDKLPALLEVFKGEDQRIDKKNHSWAGYAVGEVLGYEMGQGIPAKELLARHNGARKRAEQVIKELADRGLIIQQERKDKNRENKPTWILTEEPPF